MLHLKSARLAGWQIRPLCWSGIVLWASGVAWLVLHDLLQVKGEFGPETNPAEPWMLRVHGAAMIAALLGLGSLLVVHIRRGWGYRRQRALGITLAAMLALLTVSGHLLYYVADDRLRGAASLVHWIVGLAALPAFILHYRQGSRIRRRETG